MNRDYIHRTIRMVLQGSGALRLAYRVTTPHMRAHIARHIGVSSYVMPLADRQPYTGSVLPDGVNYVADMRADLGIGESSRAIYSALRAAQIPVNYQEVSIPVVSRTTEVETAPASRRFNVTLAHLNPSEMRLGVERYRDSFHNRYTIGYWLWEVPRFPERWRGHMEAIDELWTSSTYTQGILSKVAPVPVVHVPIPVTVQPAPLTRQDFGLPDDRYIFFFAFNPSSSVARKNPYGLIEAYRRAFEGMKNPPLLVIKAHHLRSTEHRQIAPPLREAIKAVDGVLIEDHLSRPEMHALINVSDCVVSLHRAEGFGLIMAEAMAMGKPVIATGYSSNMDFMTAANSFPVRYKLREITPEDHLHQPTLGDLYAPGQLWAEPDLDHAAELMSLVYEAPEVGRSYGLCAQQDMATYWTPRAIGTRIAARLRELSQRN